MHGGPSVEKFDLLLTNLRLSEMAVFLRYRTGAFVTILVTTAPEVQPAFARPRSTLPEFWRPELVVPVVLTENDFRDGGSAFIIENLRFQVPRTLGGTPAEVPSGRRIGTGNVWYGCNYDETQPGFVSEVIGPPGAMRHIDENGIGSINLTVFPAAVCLRAQPARLTCEPNPPYIPVPTIVFEISVDESARAICNHLDLDATWLRWELMKGKKRPPELWFELLEPYPDSTGWLRTSWRKGGTQSRETAGNADPMEAGIPEVPEKGPEAQPAPDP